MKNILIGFFACLALISVVAATRYPVYVSAPSLIQAGTCVTASDGKVTNTFATAFTAAPNVVTVQVGDTINATNRVTSITTTNFVLDVQKTTVTNRWIAIGAP